jgi:uncharacterized membrane protein
MHTERTLLRLFDIGLAVKCIDGVLESMAALLILLVPRHFVFHIVDTVTAGELGRGADDLVAFSLRDAAIAFAVHPHYFLAAYLFLHGTVKIALVAGIFLNKRYAYPLFVGSLGVFSAYEAYRAIVTHSVLLGAVATFDLLLLFLAAHEARLRATLRPAAISES